MSRRRFHFDGRLYIKYESLYRESVNERQFQQIFLESIQGSLSDLLGLRKQAEISFYMDLSPVQDSFRYRAKDLGLKIASLILDDKGELDHQRLEELNRYFGEFPFVLGPRREGDALIFGHVAKCLRSLVENKEIWNAIRKFSTPLCHKRAEEIVRETLWPEPIRSVQTVHIRKAVVASWLTLLRQTTGSCFATAPAILIQREYPLKFFKDLYDLLSTGQLRRIVGGSQYSVPLSLSSGVGDLHKPDLGLASSPGVWAALQAVEIKITGQTQEKIRELGLQTAEKLLRILLLENAGLTEEDLEAEEHLSRIQMTPLLAKQTAVYYQRPSERAQKVSEWKKKFVRACTTFKAVTECALLRSWEYTIASFCDVKTEFSRWNLYVGLGLHPDQAGGIGAFLYEEINGRLQKCNAEIERLSREYEQAIGAIQALETMMRGSASDVRINQLKAELMSHNLTVNSIVELRNHEIAKAEGLAGFFPSLLEQYDQRLQDYFQELFDPALLGEEGHLIDDSPAGFRLVYKHGRSDASQWTAIENETQYTNSLREFFSNIEGDISIPAQIGRELLSELTTALVQFIQDPEFLNSARQRSKEKGRRSPWDYISGGTLQMLLMAYSNRSKPFKEMEIVPRKEEDLLQFLKRVKGSGAHLMHSPTHAFIFYPEMLKGSSGFNRPVQKWDEQMQEHLAHQVSEKMPQEEKALFIHLYRQKSTAQTNAQFRNCLIEACPPRIKNKVALIDSVLYEQTPLFPLSQAKIAFDKIMDHLGGGRGNLTEATYLGPYDLYQSAKAALLRKIGSAFSSVDWDLKIAEAMHRLGFSQMSSILFADTNWSGWYFGFVINPATAQLELWRLNRNGTQGFPMSDWNEWLQTKNSAAWVILSDPREYIDESPDVLKNSFS